MIHIKGGTLPLFRIDLKSVLLLLVMLWLALPYFLELDHKIHLSNMLANPSLEHPFGTDNMGRDLLIRLNQAVISSIVPLYVSVLLASLFSLMTFFVIEIIKDNEPPILTRRILRLFYGVTTILSSVPLALWVFFWAVTGTEVSQSAISLSLFVIIFSRTLIFLQGLYAEDCTKEYWLAHKAFGGSLFSRLYHYGLKMAWQQKCLALLSFHLSAAVVVEVGISYLGFGAQEPNPSLGNILASHFDTYLKGDFSILFIATIYLIVSCALPRALIGTLQFNKPI